MPALQVTVLSVREEALQCTYQQQQKYGTLQWVNGADMWSTCHLQFVSIGVLQRVCTSVHCRTIEILSQLVHQDAITLWGIISHHEELAFARLPVLKILSSMLLTHRGRQVR